MFVCCECCVLSGRGLCDELITRPKESYRQWCVVACDLEKPHEWGGHSPHWAAAPQKEIHFSESYTIQKTVFLHVSHNQDSQHILRISCQQRLKRPRLVFLISGQLIASGPHLHLYQLENSSQSYFSTHFPPCVLPHTFINLWNNSQIFMTFGMSVTSSHGTPESEFQIKCSGRANLWAESDISEN
jgi:hypothetical protein